MDQNGDLRANQDISYTINEHGDGQGIRVGLKFPKNEYKGGIRLIHTNRGNIEARAPKNSYFSDPSITIPNIDY